MQFAHPRLLITSSLPRRFSSLSPPVPRRFSVLLRFLRFPSGSAPFLRRFLCRFLRFSAGFPFFRRFPSGFPPVPRRFSVLPLVFRFPACSSVFPPVPPFPRYRRLGAPPEGAVGAVTEGETAEAWEERDVVEGDAGGQSGGRCGRPERREMRGPA